MVGCSVLPVTIINNKLYFLFGKEHSSDTTPGFSDFGGGNEKGETVYQTAMREAGEELSGFLGGPSDVKKLIKTNGGYHKLVYHFPDQKDNSYHIHLFYMNYDENLPKYYNANHKYLWERMDQKYLRSTKIFEKIEIDWFSVDDIRRRRSEFRSFYQNITDMILENEKEIRAFLKDKKKKQNSHTRKNRSTH
jgi:hypothetical protein